MTNKKTRKSQSGGINIQNSRVSVAGDMVGRDKISKSSSGLAPADWEHLRKQFDQINAKIDQRSDDPDVDKAELKGLVKRIEKEVEKGEAANPSKLERWLRFLAEMADDIFQVTAATLTHPAAGVAKAVQLVAQKAKQSS